MLYYAPKSSCKNHTFCSLKLSNKKLNSIDKTLKNNNIQLKYYNKNSNFSTCNNIVNITLSFNKNSQNQTNNNNLTFLFNNNTNTPILISCLMFLALYKLNIMLSFLFAFLQQKLNKKYNYNHQKYSTTEYFSFINLSKLQRQVLKFNKLYINKFQINTCLLLQSLKINKLKHPQKWTAPKTILLITFPVIKSLLNIKI